ncbi:hypothetical protein Bca4012_006178 [Brassica carinata]
MQMDEMCMVMCGAWLCWFDGKREFVVDKRKMARMIPVHEALTIKEIEGQVFAEFKKSETSFNVVLSYWPPDSKDLATGIKTPPVLLTSDGVLRYFFSHMKVTGTLNLFATFDSLGYATAAADLDGFETPRCSTKQRESGSKRKDVDLSGVGSKTNFINLDDFQLIEEVEKLEERLMSESNPTGGGDCSGWSDGIDSDYSGPEEIDERDVRPRGYDVEFWDPLIDGDLGGSNAVEVVFNDKEANGVAKLSEGSRSEPVGESSGGGRCLKGDIHVDDFAWMGRTSLGGRNTRGQEPGGQEQSNRKLEDVDDEEFDIPPLYDDTVYEAAEIPGLDVEEADGVVHVGKVYGSKVDCQIALAIYAIKGQFQFKQTRTKVDSFVCECPDNCCDWRVTAHEIRGCGYYEIRKAQLDHSCPIESRNGYGSRGTARVIAAVYKAKFKDPSKGPKVVEIQLLLMEDLRISASYMKCYRAKEQAIFELRGPDDDSYMKLAEYLYMLKLANPGTVADIETEVDDEGVERFLYMFLAFGASIKGFQKLGHVLVVDGTHLSGKYKGVLLTESGQDGNFQKVERLLADSSNLAIISDRGTSIANAVSCVYPQAHHGFCIVHLARNVNARFSSKGLARLVTAAATAHRLRDYKNFCDKIRASNNGRLSPIIELVMFIQGMMTRWFSARRKKANKHRGFVRGSKVNSISSWSCQVVGKFCGSESVQLEQKKCTCKYFDHMKIPCGHAMIAADNLGLAYETMVGHWYKTVAWRETYAGVIRPIGDPRDEDIPDDVRNAMLMPPLTKRPPGRRRTKRFPSTGEMPGPKKKTVPNKCGRCKVGLRQGVRRGSGCGRGECFDLGIGVYDMFVVVVVMVWLHVAVGTSVEVCGHGDCGLVGSGSRYVRAARSVDDMFVVVVVMVWLDVLVGTKGGVCGHGDCD